MLILALCTKKVKKISVSISPNLSKIFEKCMFEKMSQFFENIFSKYPFGFQKSFLAMLEKWKRSADNTKMFEALLTEGF